jgi:peptidoglycan pentaglycine glycine transferase (the first glycine)
MTAQLSIIMNAVNLESTRLTRIDSQDVWDGFVRKSSGHVLQSYAWGELKSRYGWQAERWGRLEASHIQSGAQVLLRRLLPGLRIAYIPRGPISPQPNFVGALRSTLQSRGIFLLKVEPNWLRDDLGDEIMAGASFHRSAETIQPPSTIRLDLTRPEDAILSGMKPKWRYNIRLSEKKGVVVREGTAADLPFFYELLLITAKRDRFAVHPRAYYCEAFELLAGRDAARLFVAELGGQVLAMIFATAFEDEAIYLYGASGNLHRNVMPNHALHWAAIQWAKARGCKRYDLWGVPAAEVGATPSTGTAELSSFLPDSLAQFKRGFGGEEVQFTGAWDYIYSFSSYRLYRLARAVRRQGLAF